LLACGTWENTVVLWDTKTGKQIRRFGPRRETHYDTLVFSPDGRSIATPAAQGMHGGSTIDREVVLWETATGKERLRIVRNEGQVFRIAFSPNGRLLASVDWWAMPHARHDWIHVWDAWTGKEVGHLTGHRGGIRSFSFAPDGKTLASGGLDNTILIWDVTGLLPATKSAAEKLSREELARCWDDLAGTDAARAYCSMAELSRHPQQTVGFINDNLAAHPGMIAEKLAHLIADLDNDAFKTRESASKELAKLGRLAEGALKKTLDENPSAELKRRIQNLLDKLEPKEDDPEQIRLLRVIEVLERLGTPEARSLLRKLAQEASIPDVAREARVSLQRLGKAGSLPSVTIKQVLA
jgi:dipeptidyl aminopeptidase/acylaminoacyl peptidase